MISGLGEGGTLLTRSSCAWSDAAAAKRFEHLQHGGRRNRQSPGRTGHLASPIWPLPIRESEFRQPMLRILSDAPLRHPALLGYLTSRGIVPADCGGVSVGRYAIEVRSRCLFRHWLPE